MNQGGGHTLNLSRRFHPKLTLILLFGGLAFFLAFGARFSWCYSIGALLSFFLIDSLGIQIGVHKLLCHRSFAASVPVTRTLALLSVLSGQGSPLAWVAIHMSSHHPHSDTEADVHSPVHGRFYAFIQWYWKFDTSKINFLPARTYFRDPFLRFLNERHLEILLTYWICLFVAGGFPAVAYLGFFPAAASIILVGLVNCFMHSRHGPLDWLFFKYQPYQDIPTTYNSIWLGAMTMGLGLHNNHHKHPTQCFNDEHWYEVDLSRWIIPLLRSKEGKTNG